MIYYYAITTILIQEINMHRYLGKPNIVTAIITTDLSAVCK